MKEQIETLLKSIDRLLEIIDSLAAETEKLQLYVQTTKDERPV